MSLADLLRSPCILPAASSVGRARRGDLLRLVNVLASCAIEGARRGALGAGALCHQRGCGVGGRYLFFDGMLAIDELVSWRRGGRRSVNFP